MKYIKLFEKFISSQFDFETIEELKLFIDKVCSLMDIKYEHIKLLAEGGNGIAIDLGSSVLKLTYDISEVYFAYKLLNVDSPNLIKIYDVKNVESKYGNFYCIHEEKIITNLNQVIYNFLYYLHKQNPISRNVDSVSEDDVYNFFKDKLSSLSKENIMLLFNRWKNVYEEAHKYDIEMNDFHEKNVGIRETNPTELVYFDISDPYNSYSDKLRELNIEKINVK